MKTKVFQHLVYFVLAICFGCNPSPGDSNVVYHYTKPDYNRMTVVASRDTLHFGLGETMYNDIKSFNVFRARGVEYISFYDRRSETINIYTLQKQDLYKRISIKKMIGNHSLYKTSVFVKNWDSIFIINRDKLRLYDSSGHKKRTVAFLQEPDFAWAVFDSDKQPLVEGDHMYAMVRPNMRYRSAKALREWQVMYVFDLKDAKAHLKYHLPKTYRNHLYGYYFMDYNFCYNGQGKLVISFPADTVIYETDLSEYNHAYFARSRYQNQVIAPVSGTALEKKRDGKEYALRDSYGPLFFDPYKKYYLRLARHKISESQYLQRKQKSETVIVFDESLRIIGECDWPIEADFSSMFFSGDGGFYVRTNFRDENALHFVRFEYRGILNNNAVAQVKK